MKNKYLRVFLCTILCVILSVSFFVPAFAKTPPSNEDVRILFTHDMHSNMLPFDELQADGSVKNVGGYTRLYNAISERKTPKTIVVDAGDFSMGTFFNAIYKTHAPDLKMLDMMGYDAVTLGNHEFDYSPEGLTDALYAAKGEGMPQLLCANIIFPQDEVSQNLNRAFEEYGGKEYEVFEKDGIKIGVFGLLGAHAQSSPSTMKPIQFEDTTTAAKRCVAALKEQGAQLILCLSHGGTSENADKSEDQLLAKAVEGIDVIISGHSHTTLEKPIVQNKTLIVSAGCYTKNLGVLDVSVTKEGVQQTNYELVPIDENIAQNDEVLAKINEYKGFVQTEYLDTLGIKYDDVAAYSPHHFTTQEEIGRTYGEFGLADMITDAYLYELEKNGMQADVAGINSGLIRSSILQGNVTQSKLYEILSLGQGADETAGYPLVEMYITGEELRSLCEVDVSVFPIMNEAQLFFSGVKYQYNPNRLIFNKIMTVDVKNANGEFEDLQEDKLYKVVSSQYLGEMAAMITDATYGILKITPKDANGNVITDMKNAILHDKDGKEIKEWVALSDYVQSFEKNADGVPQIPEKYFQPRDQKSIFGKGITDIFYNLTIFARLVYLVLIVMIVVIVGIVILVIKKRKKKNANKKV
ncbi:MAG: bifunctional UDP-sugar hydrolase/5'-nucleotidase [Christensenellaceae bacterium]